MNLRTTLGYLGLATSFTVTSTAQDALYQTSFEKGKVGVVNSHSDQEDAIWKSSKGVVISDEHAKTGERSLHLPGGKSEVELQLSGNLTKAKGISFVAERWTARDPFEFRIEAKLAGKWKELTPLDTLVTTGKGFPSSVRLAIPEGGSLSALKLRSNTPSKSGVLIDDFTLLANPPAAPSKVLVMPTEPLELLEHNDVFVSGEDNTKIYRIPAFITCQNGDLLAVIDARRQGAADLIGQRSIDITFKRSTDNGKNWGAMETIADFPAGQGASDASLILNRDNGEIFCFYNWMGKTKEFRFYVQSSKDHGETWSKPKDFTDEIVSDSFGFGELDFKFITSGRGIHTSDGILMHNFVHIKNGVNSVRLYGSKDGGKSWFSYPAEVKPADESKVVELNDGTLMINSRYGRDFRWVHRSSDKGKTWQSEKETQLPDPRCNASLIRYTSTKDGYAKDRLLFCNAGSQKGRKNLTVRISYDEGKSWSEGKVVNTGNSAYASLTILADGTIGVLYENGNARTKFARFSLEALTDGKDKLTKPYVIK